LGEGSRWSRRVANEGYWGEGGKRGRNTGCRPAGAGVERRSVRLKMTYDKGGKRKEAVKGEHRG